MSDPFNPYQKWFGIPLDDQPPNHYRLLGLELYEDSQSKIEDAVAAQVEFLQAVSMGEHVEHAQRILSEVAMARLCLVNPKRKHEYDEQLRNPVDPLISAKPIPMATPVDAGLAMQDLKLALEVRKPIAHKQQPVAEMQSSGSTPGKTVTTQFQSPVADSGGQNASRKTWLAVPIGAVVFLFVVLIAVVWWNAQSKQQFAQANKNVTSHQSAPESGVEKLDVEENLILVAKTENKPIKKPPSKPDPAKSKPGKKNLNTNTDSQPNESVELSTASRALISDASDTNLVAYWPLNDGPANSTVSRANDLIDDDKHGAADATANGNRDKWVFDAERKRVVLSTTEGNRLTAGTQDIDLNNGFSWSLWAKVASSNITDQGADVLIGTRNGDGRKGPWHKIGNAGTSGWATIGNYEIADDTWHHIAYVGDAANGVSLYIDGKRIGTDASPASPIYNGQLEIGGSSRFTEDITALISDVAIWDKRLSEAQIQNLANGRSVLATSANAGIVVDDFVTFTLPGQGGVYHIDLGKDAPSFDASRSDKLVVMTGNRGSGGQNWGKDLTGITYGTHAMVEAVKLKSGDKRYPEEVAAIYYLDNPVAEESLTISYAGKMDSMGGLTLLALSGTAEGVSASGSSVTTGTVTSTSTNLTTTVDGSLLLAAGVADRKDPMPNSLQHAINIGRSSNFGASGQVVVTAGRVEPAFSMSSANTPITVAAAFAPAVILDANPPKPNLANPTFAKPILANSDPAKPKQPEPEPGVTTKTDSVSKPADGMPGENPFRNFAKTFELPPTADLTPTIIDDLVINKPSRMGLNLFLAEGATRNKADFKLARAPDDNQKWIVSTKHKQDLTPVAQFFRTETAFHFQWLPAATEDENVNYLRNGALKLETPDEESRWVSLREPVLIEGFQLTKDKFSVQKKADVAWLPNPNAIVVEILSFPENVTPSHCLPGFATKQPAKMYFTRDEKKAFVWLEVSASHRSDHHRLEAELKVSLQGNVKMLKPGELSQYQQYFMKLGTDTVKGIATIKAPAKKKQAEEFVKAAKTTSEVFGEYTEIIPKMYGKAIPVAIYLNVEGHRVVIATTPAARSK